MLRKQYKDNGQVEVTFIMSSEIKGSSAHVVGEFNDWSKTANRMRKQPDGSWQATILLESGREYEYRYLVGGREWHNDWEADKYRCHPMGGENSVVCTFELPTPLELTA